MQTETRPEVLTVDEVAKLMRVSRQTIYMMVRSNEIEHFRIGSNVRFKREVVDQLMNPKAQMTLNLTTETKE